VGLSAGFSRGGAACVTGSAGRWAGRTMALVVPGHGSVGRRGDDVAAAGVRRDAARGRVSAGRLGRRAGTGVARAHRGVGAGWRSLVAGSAAGAVSWAAVAVRGVGALGLHVGSGVGSGGGG